MRIIIIGAGPTGLGAAHRLHELGHTDFRVYERNHQVGGLASSFKDEHGFTWDITLHVVHSHYRYFDHLLDRLLPGGFFHHQRRAWVRAFGTYIPYPFQYNIRHLPDNPRNECIAGLEALSVAKADPEAAANFRDWILATSGTGIAKHFMLPYNRKVWTVDPAEMSHGWLGDRVPGIDVSRALRNIAGGVDDVAWGSNATFRFPKSGGTGAIWEALARQFPPERVRLGAEVTTVDPVARRVHFTGGGIDHYDHLITTLPLTRFTALAGLTDLHRRASGLKHTRVHVAGIALPSRIPAAFAGKTWIYCPEDACCFYRVTPFSTFSPDLTPGEDCNSSLLCETSSPGDQPFDSNRLVHETLSGLRKLGLLSERDKPRHTHLATAEYGYPIPTLERDGILSDVLPALARHNILSRGRFGGWKYEVSNMDHSLMQGVEAVNHILLGEEEITLFQPHVVNAGKR